MYVHPKSFTGYKYTTIDVEHISSSMYVGMTILFVVFLLVYHRTRIVSPFSIE